MTLSSFDWSPPEDPPVTPAVVVEVFRYDGAGGYEALPNVQVLDIQRREGLEPMTARCAYVMDDLAVAMGWPAEFEIIMALAYRSDAESADSPNRQGDPDPSRYVVRPDDRIVIKATDADDVTEILFDGFAQAPQTNVSGRHQAVTFTAASVAVRLFAYPVMDRRQAWSGLKPTDVPTADALQRVVQSPARFNEDGLANCTPEAQWLQADSGESFPLFYDGDQSSDVKPVMWTLANAAKYILGYHLADSEFVKPPEFDALDRLLNRRMPKLQDPFGIIDPALFYDPDDPSTYIEEPIILRDFDMSGLRWPDALERLLNFSGFAAEFVTEDGGDGTPTTHLNVYRKDGGGPYDPKTISLQPRHATLSTSKSMLGGFGVVRDYHDAFNAVAMDAYPALVEVSVVLGMAGPTDPGDPANSADFGLGRVKGTFPNYRVWRADELGGGHLSKTGSVVTDAFDFTKAFAVFDDPDDPNPTPPARRLRPGGGELISLDSGGSPKKAKLYFSRNYTGETATLWDGTGSWQETPHGWELLEDRLGVLLTADNLEAWSIGVAGYALSGVVRVITSMAAPDAQNKRLFLRLDTVIEADVKGFDDLPSRKASALKWDRFRYIDGKGAFRRKFIHESSPNFTGSKDDGKAATPDADSAKDGYTWMGQIQAAGEDPSIAGPITIPWHTRAYRIGDRISAIDGRDLSLQVNQGTENGEAPAYPFVVGVSWSFGDKEETTLDLSDHRATPDDPHSRRR